MDWRTAKQSVYLPLLIFPCTLNLVQKFSSGTGSPEWFPEKGRKMVVVVVYLTISSQLKDIETLFQIIVKTAAPSDHYHHSYYHYHYSDICKILTDTFLVLSINLIPVPVSDFPVHAPTTSFHSVISHSHHR